MKYLNCADRVVVKNHATAFKIRDGQEYAYPRILQYYPHIKWFYYFVLCTGFFLACFVTISAIYSVSWLSRNYITIPNSSLMLIGVLIGMSVLGVLAIFLKARYCLKPMAFSSIQVFPDKLLLHRIGKDVHIAFDDIK